MQTYRGYDIQQDAKGNWFWIDERGFTHNGEPGEKFTTDEQALNDVDAYKRNMRTAAGA